MPDAPPTVDTITEAPAEKPPAASADVIPDAVKRRAKVILVIALGTPYILYVLWALFLMAVLPSSTGELQALARLGTLSAIVGAVCIVAVGGMAFMRVAHAADFSDRVRKRGLIRIGLFVLPGLLVSAAVPFVITREPALPLMIVEPARPEDFVAPLAVTFSLEDALKILEKKNLRPVGFEWDYNGDGTKDEDTVVPTATAFYDRQGAYTVVVKITLSDRSTRRLTNRVIIPQAVFSIAPLRPVVDEPISFSIAHLLPDPKQLREARWDFDEDGNPDEITTKMNAVRTFYRTGPVKVSVTVLLQTQVQNTYERTIEIREPEPLPFPVTLVSEPTHLISPEPFGTLFRIETEEPVASVSWDFGDEKEAEGARVGHTFESNGNFLVIATVRSEAGPIAKLRKLVRVVEKLNLPDLAYDGQPEVRNNAMKGEVPVTVNLTPRTSQPLVEFLWEAPEASTVGSTEKTLQAVYRRPGKYIITLLAQDPSGRAVRIPIALEVTPPASLATIKMIPEGGVAPLKVRFDGSETVIPGKEISGFEWYIGEEKTPRQAGAQLEYLFAQPGTYDVRLVARTTDGGTHETTRTIVVRAPVLDACFLSSRTSGQAPLGVSFDMACTTGTPASVRWDFGDGSQSDEQSPIHVFEQSGTFTVVLTLQDASGTVSTESVVITVQ